MPQQNKMCLCLEPHWIGLKCAVSPKLCLTAFTVTLHRDAGMGGNQTHRKRVQKLTRRAYVLFPNNTQDNCIKDNNH